MIIQKLQQFGKNLLHVERSVKKLTLSTCLGIFIAFSPFIGLHTLMALSFCWLFSLNYPVTLTVQLAINNPWTMLPVYGCGYGFGRIISTLCRIDFTRATPACITYFLGPVCTKIGMSADTIWTAFIGGNVLSILLAISMYVPIQWVFNKLEHPQATSGL